MSFLLMGVVIPFIVGILGNLSVPPLQRWLSKRSDYVLKRSLASKKKEYAEVISFAAAPDFLASELVSRTMLFAALAVILLLIHGIPTVPTAAVPSSFLTHIHSSTGLFWGAFGLDLLINLFAVITAFRFFRTGVLLYGNVRFFEDYVENVPSELRQRKIEAAIIAGRRNRLCIGFPPDDSA